MRCRNNTDPPKALAPRTVAEVEAALIHAVRVIERSTSRPGPKRLRATHPEIVRDYADALAAEPMRDPASWAWSRSRIPPSGDAIDAAQAVMGWLQLVKNERERFLLGLWIACKVAPRGTERSQFPAALRRAAPGTLVRTARYAVRRALAEIAAALAAENSNKVTDFSACNSD